MRSNVDNKKARGLVAGAASTEITPPLEIGLLMSSGEKRWAPFKRVRMPLKARALVLGERHTTRRLAIVSLDLLGLSGTAVGGFPAFKAAIAEASGHAVAPEDVVLVCTHTHCGPESVALTDLYRTEPFPRWVATLSRQIGEAIREAANLARPCRLEYGTQDVHGLTIHRRIKTTRGVMLAPPEPPADIVLSREGAVDDSVNVAALRNLSTGAVIALLVNSTCHPVYEMCMEHVSPDYPGELSVALEQTHRGSVVLFLNGAAGNINPTTVSSGPDEARRHAEVLARAVGEILKSMKPTTVEKVSLLRRSFQLPTRLPVGQVTGQMLSAEIAGLRLGDAVFMFLPGEVFVETGLTLKDHTPFEFTPVVAYAEDGIGYIPTDQAYAEGGYETRFGRWSILAPGCEPILRREALALLEDLREVEAAGAQDNPKP